MTSKKRDLWELREDGFSPSVSRAWEGLFTLGSGYLHTRGSLEEGLTDAAQNSGPLRMPANVTIEPPPETPAKWGTYVPGIFAPHPTLKDEMVNLPWFLELVPSVNGEKLDMIRSTVEEHSRSLDMHNAVLRRRLRWKTAAGAVLTLEYERFISAEVPSLSVQRLVLNSDRNTTVHLRAGIDADIRTNGFDHYSFVNFERALDNTVLCRVATNGGDDVTTACSMSGPLGWSFEQGPRSARLAASFKLKKKSEFVVEKLSAVSTSRDRSSSDALSVLEEHGARTWEDLLDAHAAKWRARWRSAEVEIDTDEEVQQALRLSLYHLLRSHPDDERVAIDAKGYAGEGYYGRFFWDTEMYLLPFYIYTDPPRARKLCDFRLLTLKGAKANARAYGYSGARYAWESNARGEESCAAWQYADHEVHVTADVVYGLGHYASAAEAGYLRGPAAETVLETARYWMERIDYDAQGRPELLGVMGPDEYTPICNNSAYTNYLVARNLALAGEVGPEAGALTEECSRFRRVAEALPIPRKGDLVLQCDGFTKLADPRFEEFWRDRTKGFGANVLQERMYRSKCLKQADVILLQVLYPGEFTDAECRAAWDYYLPLTTHDSSLSVGVHAIMAARLGMAGKSWEFFKQGLFKDLDIGSGAASEGIHIAGCGCSWMVAVFGFGGLRTAEQCKSLTLNPALPPGVGRLAFPLLWKGVPVRVEIFRDNCRVTNNGQEPLEAIVAGKQLVVDPGKTEEVKLKHMQEGTDGN
ncbi:MAG: glycosyl hydrolase family 65 protein [Kiritimatiellia bacterium]